MKRVLYLILTGVAIVFLVIPDKVSETLRMFKDKYNDLKHGAMDHINGIVSKGQDFQGKDLAGGTGDEV